jgi:hypothetical protein
MRVSLPISTVGRGFAARSTGPRRAQAQHEVGVIGERPTVPRMPSVPK